LVAAIGGGIERRGIEFQRHAQRLRRERGGDGKRGGGEAGGCQPAGEAHRDTPVGRVAPVVLLAVQHAALVPRLATHTSPL
jgi:hypothetical protein